MNVPGQLRPRLSQQGLERMGNAAGAAVWEATLPPAFERPQDKAELERFVSQKYVSRKVRIDIVLTMG